VYEQEAVDAHIVSEVRRIQLTGGVGEGATAEELIQEVIVSVSNEFTISTTVQQQYIGTTTRRLWIEKRAIQSNPVQLQQKHTNQSPSTITAGSIVQVTEHDNHLFARHLELYERVLQARGQDMQLQRQSWTCDMQKEEALIDLKTRQHRHQAALELQHQQHKAELAEDLGRKKYPVADRVIHAIQEKNWTNEDAMQHMQQVYTKLSTSVLPELKFLMENLVRQGVITEPQYLALAVSGTNITAWKEFYTGHMADANRKRPREETVETPAFIPVDEIRDLYHKYHDTMCGVFMVLHACKTRQNTDALTVEVFQYVVTKFCQKHRKAPRVTTTCLSMGYDALQREEGARTVAELYDIFAACALVKGMRVTHQPSYVCVCLRDSPILVDALPDEEALPFVLKYLMVECRGGAYVTPLHYLPLLVLSTPSLEYILDNVDLKSTGTVRCTLKIKNYDIQINLHRLSAVCVIDNAVLWKQYACITNKIHHLPWALGTRANLQMGPMSCLSVGDIFTRGPVPIFSGTAVNGWYLSDLVVDGYGLISPYPPQAPQFTASAVFVHRRMSVLDNPVAGVLPLGIQNVPPDTILRRLGLSFGFDVAPCLDPVVQPAIPMHLHLEYFDIEPGPWRTEDTVFVSEGKSIRQQMYEVHTDLISVREKWGDDGNTDD
jgi:hypothetical protein